MNTTGDTYEHYRIAVPAAFDDVFSHFYYARNNTAETLIKTLLPSYQTIMVFNFGIPATLVSKEQTQIDLDQCLVLGPIKQAFDYVLPPNSEILVANFRDEAFYRFFGQASLAARGPVNPDTLYDDNCFKQLWLDMQDTPEPAERVNHLLKFCAPYLKNRDETSAKLAGFQNPVLNAIKSVAELNQQSERNIQMHHKKHFGFSAKELSRYKRFLKAIQLLQTHAEQNKSTDWFEVIDICGYYDQSQLNKDFKQYLHLSPKQYLKFQHDICKANI